MAGSRQRKADELALLKRQVKRLQAALARVTPSLSHLLKRRGFLVYKKEPQAGLLVPAEHDQPDFYRMLGRYSFRLFLRDAIKLQKGFTIDQAARYATARVTREYAEYLAEIGLLHRRGARYVLAPHGVTSFGPTLEWYVAEIFRREFGCEAMWGVKFRRPKVGGDYDVIAKLEGSLVYVEVKSSPPKQIYDSEVAAFLDRVDDLAPAAAVFLIDTELRMKDKLVPMFEAALKGRSNKPPPVIRMERELFHINGRIFIANAKESIARNLEKVLSRHYAGPDRAGEW